MTLRIGLLGVPRLEVDGDARRPEGRKSWGLLAYILLADRAPTRRELAERLWSEADDPLRAQRWTLVQVRRALEPSARIVEEDGRLRLAGHGDDVPRTDALPVLAGALTPAEAEALPSAELLEGFDFASAPAFEHWLLLQRSRVRSAVIDAWRTAAIEVADDPARALLLLDRVIAADPVDDAAHELIVDLHLARHDRWAADEHLRHAERLYRHELGVPPPAMLWRPLERGAGAPQQPPVPPAAAARALLELAAARLDTGEYPAAIDAGRRAADEAAAAGDAGLEARCLLTLAGALIHSVRGRDDEGRGLLGRALRLARAERDLALVAEVERELGYVDFLRAEYGAAEAMLARSIATAARAGDAGQEGRGLTILGACQSDRGAFDEAERTLVSALERLDPAGERRWAAFARSFVARLLLRTGRAEAAREEAGRSVDLARQTGWLSLLPWPMAVLGEAQLACSAREPASATFGGALILARDIGDPCWEAFALRGMSLVAFGDGDAEEARTLLEGALDRCRSLPDTYKWAEALILADLVTLAGDAAPVHLSAAEALVMRGPMADLADRIRGRLRGA